MTYRITTTPPLVPAPTQHLYIVTGTSRGIGLAMAQQLLAPSNTIVGLARRFSPELDQQAQDMHCPLEQWPVDLVDAQPAAQRLRDWLGTSPQHTYASASLINNAGVITDIAPLSQCTPDALIRALRVGLEAPMLLTAAFLSATAAWTAPRKVLNISSGLGRKPMASQTSYCAAKAGMDHFTRCLAIEESHQTHGASVCSLAPGVIDTDMQTHLRQAPPANFADVGHFIQLQRHQQLSTPEHTARQVLAYLHHPHYGQYTVDDVRSTALNIP